MPGLKRIRSNTQFPDASSMSSSSSPLEPMTPPPPPPLIRPVPSPPPRPSPPSPLPMPPPPMPPPPTPPPSPPPSRRNSSQLLSARNLCTGMTGEELPPGCYIKQSCVVPIEIAYQVFRHMEQNIVCPLHDMISWEDIESFFEGDHTSPVAVLCECSPTAGLVRGLYEDNFTHIVTYSLEWIYLLPSHIKVLRIHSFDITDGVFDLISNRVPNLKALHVNNARYITNNGLATIVRNMSGLEHLSMYNCRRIDPSGLFIIANAAIHIKTLCLVGCQRISKDCFDLFIEKTPSIMCAYCSVF